MKRTRKWTFVAQEATRLAALGLRPREIAKRLDLAKSTVTRWIAAGKLAKPAPSTAGPPRDIAPSLQPSTATPEQWAARVRADYALDATDEQLVQLAEAALRTAWDPLVPVRVQLSAMARFQALVKHLALVTRYPADVPAPVPAPPPPPAPTRVPRLDPRHHLQAVK